MQPEKITLIALTAGAVYFGTRSQIGGRAEAIECPELKAELVDERKTNAWIGFVLVVLLFAFLNRNSLGI